MSQYCITCHTEILVDGGLCPNCDGKQKIPQIGPVLQPSIDDEQVAASSQSSQPSQGNFGRIWIGLGAVLLLGLVAAYYYIFIRDDMVRPGGKPTVTAASSAAIPDKSVTLFAITKANIRDAATTSGSSIVGTLARGSPVQGQIITGSNSEDTWMQLTDGRGFVSSVNLRDTAPPPFLKLLSDKVWKTDVSTDIYSAPSGGELIDRVEKNTALTLAGLVSGDSIEIKLRSGGTGYIMDGARIIALLQTPAAEPITLSFRPDNCDFGGGIGAALAQLARQQDARRTAIEKRNYPNPDARQAALEAYDAKIEGRSAFAKLNREYNGLTVSGVGIHYESQSIYFDDPPAKVIAVFKQAGYKIGSDGDFQTSELYAGIGSRSKGDSIRGKSELNCGV